MGFTRSPLPQNNGNLPLPFFGGNDPIVLLDNIYYILYVTLKNGGNDNYPDSLNVMVNYNYHSENRMITW